MLMVFIDKHGVIKCAVPMSFDDVVMEKSGKYDMPESLKLERLAKLCGVQWRPRRSVTTTHMCLQITTTQLVPKVRPSYLCVCPCSWCLIEDMFPATSSPRVHLCSKNKAHSGEHLCTDCCLASPNGWETVSDSPR